MQNNCLIAIFCLLLISLQSHAGGTGTPEIHHGAIDLGQPQQPLSQQLSLEGEWHFYPGRLLSPEQVATEQINPASIHVPGPWSKLTQFASSPESGTYLLQLKGLSPTASPSLYIKQGMQ